MSTPRSRPPLPSPLQGQNPLTRARTRLRDALGRFVTYEKSAERQRSVRPQLVQEDESPSSSEPGPSPRRRRTASVSPGDALKSEPNGSDLQVDALYLGALHKSLRLESAPRKGARHRCTPRKGLRLGSPWLESLRLESTPQPFAPKIKPSANSHLKRTVPCLLSGTRLGKECGMGRVSHIGFSFRKRRGAGVACWKPSAIGERCRLKRSLAHAIPEEQRREADKWLAPERERWGETSRRLDKSEET
jgi:hypothetical protein